jgi:hypothetical protein
MEGSKSMIFVCIVLSLVLLCSAETDPGHSQPFEISSCLRNESNREGNLENCMQTLREKDKFYYNSISQYFMKRSSFQPIIENFRAERKEDLRGFLQKGIEEKILPLLSVVDQIQKEIKLLHQTLDKLNEKLQPAFTYSTTMKRRAATETFGWISSKGILCNSRGELTVDWNIYAGQNWLKRWQPMVQGSNDCLFFYTILPEQGNEIVVFIELWRIDKEIVLKMGYLKEPKIHPGPLTAEFHLKLTIWNKNGDKTIISRYHLNGQISEKTIRFLTIPTPIWSSFDQNKLPTLAMQWIELNT